MSIYSKWEELSKWLWKEKGSKLQSQYDEIKSWKIPEWAKEIVQKIDAVLLSTASLAFLKKFALEVCKKFDDKMAKDLIEAVVGVMSEKEGE